MQALVFGVRPDERPDPGTDNHLLQNLARTPMRLQDWPDPDFLRPDWVITRPRLTGICGSDAKQVFMDFGDGVRSTDNPMTGWFRMPRSSATRWWPTWWPSARKCLTAG